MSNASDVLDVVMPVLALGHGGPPEIVVGRLPDSWPESLTPLTTVNVRGGIVSGDRQTAVLEYPSSSERSTLDYRNHIEQNGWQSAQLLDRGAFDSGIPGIYRAGSLTATVAAEPAPPFERCVVVSVTTSPALQRGKEWRPPHLPSRVPRLDLPAGARGDHASWSGGHDTTTHNTRLTTDLAPADLLRFFAAQLTTAGWQLGEASAGDDHASQWLTTEIEGALWRGQLGIYRNDSIRDVFIYIAKAPH